jgi:hypothetical protein
MTGARYEITVDGVGRTNRDTREIAIEAANVLKAKNPHSRVMVRDRETGVTIEATGHQGRSWATHDLGLVVLLVADHN